MDASFHNDDALLLGKVEAAETARRKAGLDGLVGDLVGVVINAAPGGLTAAADELVRTTAHACVGAIDNPLSESGPACLLLRDGLGADIVLACRDGGDNPFTPYNTGLKTGAEAPARLETFLFACTDIDRYVAIQKARGVRFATEAPVRHGAVAAIATLPSVNTGNAIGLVQFDGDRPAYAAAAAGADLGVLPAKPGDPWLSHIRGIDHVATRVRARQRDAAIVEFLELTNYSFDFAVYVESLNSITNVARLSGAAYAQVFTSGIAPSDDPTAADAGPTERFIANYGLRPHHVALTVEGIEAVVAGLGGGGMSFLSELVGSREDGLKQIFSRMSPRTMLVHEYIERYDGFDGFFTKGNVTRLTKATEKQ